MVLTVTVDDAGRISVQGDARLALGLILSRVDMPHVQHFHQSMASSGSAQLRSCDPAALNDGADDDATMGSLVAASIATLCYFHDPDGLRKSLVKFRRHVAAPRN